MATPPFIGNPHPSIGAVLHYCHETLGWSEAKLREVVLGRILFCRHPGRPCERLVRTCGGETLSACEYVRRNGIDENDAAADLTCDPAYLAQIFSELGLPLPPWHAEWVQQATPPPRQTPHLPRQKKPHPLNPRQQAVDTLLKRYSGDPDRHPDGRTGFLKDALAAVKGADPTLPNTYTDDALRQLVNRREEVWTGPDGNGRAPTRPSS